MTIQIDNVTNEIDVVSASTNASMTVMPKGTGAINLAPGSSGVNISNGMTVTAITTATRGSGYTSFPSVDISAPTTAGGSTATATSRLNVNSASLAAGGTGYTVNDVLTASGITGGTVTFRVDSLGAGNSVATFTITNFGAGTVSAISPNPVSVTGGTGSGATFNINWNIGNIVITNAGSGYVEQPTVTFSGGGGSGAAAYATVGGTTTVKSIGHTGTVAMRFDVPSSLQNNVPAFRLIDAASAHDSGVQIFPGIASATINAFGSTNATLNLHGQASGGVSIGSGGTGQVRQFLVSHTASAVNYVQVTGAATGGASPTLSSQGSDTNVNLAFTTKGSGEMLFFTNGGSARQFQVAHTASTVNRLQVTGSITGAGPIVSSQGTDTNIDLNLTTKGTGAVRLNTGGGLGLRVNDTFGGGTSANWWELTSRGSGSAAFFGVGGETNTTGIFYVKGTGALRFSTGASADNGTGSIDQFRVAHTASAVNYVQVTGAATTGQPTISAQGSDTNIGLNFLTKGTFNYTFQTSGGIQFGIAHTASSVNYLRATGSAAGAAPSLTSFGTDTDIDLTLTPKGTGLVQFGTHTATVLTISGYIEIKDAGGTIRKLAVVT